MPHHGQRRRKEAWESMPRWKLPHVQATKTALPYSQYHCRGLFAWYCKHRRVKCPSLELGEFFAPNLILRGLYGLLSEERGWLSPSFIVAMQENTTKLFPNLKLDEWLARPRGRVDARVAFLYSYLRGRSTASFYPEPIGGRVAEVGSMLRKSLIGVNSVGLRLAINRQIGRR
jgi:hypothetical protein